MGDRANGTITIGGTITAAQARQAAAILADSAYGLDWGTSSGDEDSEAWLAMLTEGPAGTARGMAHEINAGEDEEARDALHALGLHVVTEFDGCAGAWGGGKVALLPGRAAAIYADGDTDTPQPAICLSDLEAALADGGAETLAELVRARRAAFTVPPLVIVKDAAAEAPA